MKRLNYFEAHRNKNKGKRIKTFNYSFLYPYGNFKGIKAKHTITMFGIEIKVGESIAYVPHLGGYCKIEH